MFEITYQSCLPENIGGGYWLIITSTGILSKMNAEIYKKYEAESRSLK